MSPELVIAESRRLLSGDVSPPEGLAGWLHLDESGVRRLRLEAGPLAGLPRLSLAERLERASWRLRRPFIDWIGELSELNQGRGADWWASELAAKNPYYPLFTRLCLAEAARVWLAEERGAGPVLAACATPGMAAALESLAAALGMTARRWEPAGPSAGGRLRSALGRARRAVLGDGSSGPPPEPDPGEELARRREALQEAGFSQDDARGLDGAALLCTWIDGRSLTPEGGYRDAYFGVLPEELASRGARTAFLARVLPGQDFAAAARALASSGQRFVWPELHLRPEDLAACRRRAREFSPRIPDGAQVAGLPAAGLARELVEETRRDMEVSLSYQPLAAGLARAGARPERVVFGCEGHAWEQVWASGCRESLPQARLVAYDNLTFSRLVLGMFPAAAEWGLRPLPDLLVTNGPAFREVLLEEGWPPELVAAGCGIRHAYLWQEDPPSPREPEEPLRVLVASPIGFAETVELAAKAAAAFGGRRGYEVRVKCHPTLDAGRVAARLGGAAGAEGLDFVEAPVAELLAWADLCLYAGTTVGFEALRLGVPPVFVRAESGLNLDKLEAAGEVRWAATSPEQLQEAAGEIRALAGEARRRWRRRAERAVARALAPAGPECARAFWS